MKRAAEAHLRKYRQWLSVLDDHRSQVEVFRRRAKLGTWESLSMCWQETTGKIRLRFSTGQRLEFFQVSSIKATSGGLRFILSSVPGPGQEELLISWGLPSPEFDVGSGDVWEIGRQWLREVFPDGRILSASRRPDLMRSLSGSFLRLRFRAHGCERLLLVAGSDNAERDCARSALTQALLWLSSGGKHRVNETAVVFLLAPSAHAHALFHRAQFLNPAKVQVEVWEFDGNPGMGANIRKTAPPPLPVEERDFRWPVLGPFRWSPLLGQVMELAPDCIRRYPRFQDYDSLRLWGLEFAIVTGIQRDRVCFGVGSRRTELGGANFCSLRALVDEILYFRRPDSPDVQHPYYRLQAERWLEALILEQVDALFPELVPESVYPQIPVYLGNEPGRVDILGADRQGSLVVIELKVSQDPDLPIQSLDYWGRVIRHNLNGDFERRGYFCGIHLSRRKPRIYLVSPIFSFHDSTERVLGYLDPGLEVWKIAINEDWRCGVKILRRVHVRCGSI